MRSLYQALRFIAWVLLIDSAQALPGQLPQYSPAVGNGSQLHEIRSEIPSSALHLRQDPPTIRLFYLRICSLGASITNGYESSDGNGYRKHLRDQLRFTGWPVNMVGSISSGTMNDNQNEGHDGLRIDQILTSWLPITYQPNLVLINVGTNDALQNYEVSTAGERMIQLLDKLWADVPGATVILSTLIPNTNAAANANAQLINEQYSTTVMNNYVGKGKKLLLCNMNDGFITVADLNTKDGTHPTDGGYLKMAAVWWSAFQEVDSYGWLTAPVDTGVPDNEVEVGYTCPKVFGDGSARTQIQVGSGTDDGPYVHSSSDQGTIFTFPWTNKGEGNGGEGPDGNFGLDHVFFAMLVYKGSTSIERRSAVDDIVYVWENNDGSYDYYYWPNLHNDQSIEFGLMDYLDPKQSCPPERVRFADMNNDGLDDFICLDDAGNLYMSLNLGGTFPDFQYIGLIGEAPAGYTYDLVRLADMDGDGRVDYCIISHPGDIICQRNGGQGTAPLPEFKGFWQDFATGSGGWTTMFPSQHKGNAPGVTLIDLNGDFKADWLYMDETGQVETFINHRGGNSDGMVPNWQSTGITHAGLGSFNITDANRRVKFGRMYETGRRDYIWIKAVKDTITDDWTHSLHVWKNEGAGGTYVKGDGTNYCDMDGDHFDDYIWVGPSGSIDIYINNKDAPHWTNHLGVTNLNLPRKGLRFADIDGDGKCDILYVDPVGGAVSMYHNQYDGTWGPDSFVYIGLISPDNLCTAGDGVGETDLAVRFADLTGNGRADYLCMELDTQVTGYLNGGLFGNKVEWENVGQIKLETTYDRANVRFNDVNGDGRADLLWINKYTGDTTVWYNSGRIPTSGSSFEWALQGPLYRGWDRGSVMHFAALGGQGRADIIDVTPSTNIAYVSYNKCSSGGSGGDDPNMGDPHLPAYNASTSCVSNGDGTCSINIGPDTGGFSDEYLPPFQSTTSYSEGDAFLFDTPITSDLNLNLIMIGAQIQWEETDCGLVSADGVDVGTLGCIAASVAWMSYSIYLDGGPVITTPIRSLPAANYHFQAHPEWAPIENCTMRCMLLAGAPQHTWIPVGNGTHNGVYHELHFIHTDNIIGHRAIRGVYSDNSTLTARQYVYGYPHKPSYGQGAWYAYSRVNNGASYRAAFEDYPTPTGVADFLGVSIEESVSVSNSSGFCVTLLKNGTISSTTLWGFSQTDSEWATTAQAEEDLTKCGSDESEPDKNLGSVLMVCGANLTLIDPSLLNDPIDNLNPNILARGLTKRVGASNHYKVPNYLDPTDDPVIFESATYVNGNNGQTLIDAGGDDHVYALANPGPCTDATIRDDAPIIGPNRIVVNAEHVMERVTAPYFFEFIQNPVLDLLDGNGLTRAPANLRAIPFNIIRDYMAIPYSQWPSLPTDHQVPSSLFADFADSLGSTNNVDVMTNLEEGLNNVKSRVWDTNTLVSSNDVFNPLAATPTIANTQTALDLLRSGITIFNYINDANIQNLLGLIHHGISSDASQFDQIYNGLVTNQQPTNLRGLWVTFINFWAQRIVNNHRIYATARIAQLIAPWNTILAGNPSDEEIIVARTAIAEIQRLSAQLPGLIFNRNNFV